MNLVQHGKMNGKPRYVLPHQQINFPKQHKTLTFNAQGSIPSTLLSSGGTVYINVSNSGGIVKSSTLVVDIINASSAVTLAPTCLWIDRIITYSDQGSKEAQVVYGENLYFNLNALPAEKLETYGRYINMTPEGHTLEQTQVASRRYHIPLVGHYLEGLYLSGLPSEVTLECRFHVAVESGTSTNVTIGNNGVSLLVETESLSSQEESQMMKMYKSGKVEKVFPSWQHWSVNTTLVGGTEYIANLNSITGKVAYLQVVLRQSSVTTNSAKAKREFDQIGDDISRGTIDLKDKSGQAVISTTALDSEYIRYIDSVKHFNGKMFAHYPIYTVVHGDPISALQGIPEGYHQYDGNMNLHINGGISTSETNRVITFLFASEADFSTGTAADNGEYRIHYRRGDGNVLVSAALAYNAANATIDSELSRMFLNYPFLTGVSVRGADDATGLAITISGITDDDLSNNDAWLTCESQLEDGGTGMLVDVVETTAGTVLRGLPSATRTLSVYACVFRKVIIDNTSTNVADL